MPESSKTVIDQIKSWLIPILLGVIGFFLQDMHSTLNELKRNVDTIRVNSATVNEQIRNHEYRLQQVEKWKDRVTHFETELTPLNE